MNIFFIYKWIYLPKITKFNKGMHASDYMSEIYWPNNSTREIPTFTSVHQISAECILEFIFIASMPFAYWFLQVNIWGFYDVGH